jgi:hypothetical protein
MLSIWDFATAADNPYLLHFPSIQRQMKNLSFESPPSCINHPSIPFPSPAVAALDGGSPFKTWNF